MKKLSLLVLFTIVLAGCGGGAVRPPVETAVERIPVTDERLFDAVRERSAYWLNYQANAQIRAEGESKKFSFQTVILANLPDRYRLDAFKLGQMVGAMSLEKERSSLWIPSEKVVYRASRAETLIGQLLGIPIPIKILGYSLIACVPPDQMKGLRFFREGTELVGYSEGAGDDFEIIWKFQSHPLALKTIQARQGSRKYMVEYEPPVELTPQAIPKKIKLSSSQWHMDVAVEQLRSIERFDESLMKVSMPGPLKEIDLDATQ